jgi:hypothetical protein
MLYLNTPFSAMTAMFQQAVALGASHIRLNIELSSVFPGPSRRGKRRGALSALRRPYTVRRAGRLNPLADPHWGGVDEYMRLARRYHLHVLAVLTATPWWMAHCPRGTPPRSSYECPPKFPAEWGRAVGEIAAHTTGVIDDFEILNEPDGHWSFLGSPRQYAALLAASHDAIHAANPAARVVLGGLMHVGWVGRRWVKAMLATPGKHAARKFDVANIHLRVPPREAGRIVFGWRTYLSHDGFHGPMWVTETGYPANPDQQTEPGFQDGPPAQARWLADVIPAMLANGVAQVFVTERDLGTGRFASEGILNTADPLPARPAIKRRPGFYAAQRLAERLSVPTEVRATR